MTHSAAETAAQIIQQIAEQKNRSEIAYIHGEVLARSDDESFSDTVKAYLTIVGRVASYHLRRENTQEPYGPVFQSPEGRSAIPADLAEDDLKLLIEFEPYCPLTELKARINDVLWLRKRELHFAEKAIESYLACAREHFDLEHWTFPAECAERALRLGSMFRRKNPELIQSAVDLFLEWIRTHAEADQKFMTLRAIQLLNSFGFGDADEFFAIAQKIGGVAEKAGDFHRTENYWAVAVDTARRLGDENKVVLAQTALAESYVSNARSHQGSGMYAAHWMQQSIEAYKAVPGSRERREELYRELLQYQEASLSEMKKVEHRIDISDQIKATVELLEGKPPREAFFTLVFGLGSPPDYGKLRQKAREIAQKHPLQSLFGMSHLDSEGKVVAKSPGSFDHPEGVPDREVFQLASFEHQVFVMGTIIPAIDVLMAEHRISEESLLSILVNNPFVARGQEPLYARGLYAGLRQDFIVAMPILVPLLENSIRLLLRKAGVRVSTLNTHGVQEELRIKALLDHEKTSEILGEDVVQDLRGLLIERTYGNLRNAISHGLATVGTFHQPPVVYLWWLILRLVCTPHFEAMAGEQGSVEGD